MQKIIHWIQHAPFENLGAIQLWCDQRGIQSIQHNIYEENLDFLINININNPEILGFIFMGGPMNVDEHDVYPFLVPEKKFLKNNRINL